MNWLLLRGLAREQRHWGRFPALLSAKLPGDRVFCLDLPGTGTEHRRKSPASIAAIPVGLRRACSVPVPGRSRQKTRWPGNCARSTSG